MRTDITLRPKARRSALVAPSGLSGQSAVGSVTVQNLGSPKLLMVTQPSNIVSDQPFGPVAVRLVDSNGTFIPLEGVPVTISALVNGIFTPATVDTDPSGLALFDTVTYFGETHAATPLTFSSGGYVSVDSVPVTFLAGTLAPANSSVKFTGARVNTTTLIVVTLHDTADNVVDVSTALVAVTVSGANTRSMNATYIGAGQYSASYVPSVAGTDSVVITVNGTQVLSSPFVRTIAPANTAGVADAQHSRATVPATVAVGQSISITVQGRDTADNLATSNTGATVSAFINGTRNLIFTPHWIRASGTAAPFSITAPWNTYWDGCTYILPPAGQAAVIADLNTLQSRDQYCLLNFTGSRQDWAPKDPITGKNVFDFTIWKSRLDRWPSGNWLDPFVTNGVFGGHYVADEPFHQDLQPPMTVQQVNAMCLYSHQKWPNVPTFIRADPISMKTIGGDGLPELEGMWGQFEGNHIPSAGETPQHFQDRMTAAMALYLQGPGKLITMGSNARDGGIYDPANPGFPGTFANPITGRPPDQWRWAMRAAEVQAAGLVWNSQTTAPFAAAWRADLRVQSDIDWLSAPVQAAFLAVMNAARKPKQTMNVVSNGDGTWTLTVTPTGGAGMRTVYIAINGVLINRSKPYRFKVV